jgi:glycosyltransferase involved in cell wall biosynthesis
VTRARLYQTLRTAHLERAHQLLPATILFQGRRYDFDEAAASGLDLVQTGPLGIGRYVFGSKISELEINEPLMRYSIRTSALALVALRARDLLRRRRTLVVTYAIENLDPFRTPASSLRGRLRAASDRALTRFVWRRVDRIAYGTGAARVLYESILPPHRRPLDSASIPALPAPCAAEDVDRMPHRVVYLGALTARKGFPLVMEAWDRVLERRPDATLLIMGKGALEQAAIDWAAPRSSVTVLIDPERREIHRQLASTQVLTLPSQPAPAWREQVGLPIVEGLSHGASIVTTTETGIADWLAANGHAAIRADAGAAELADAIIGLLEHPVPEAEVIASLPPRDGRLAADDWLFRTA